MSNVSTRLVRLLNMVPYFQANPRITFDEAAGDLGVSTKQLREDINQLWMCGLPGYGPGDLIDFAFPGDDAIEVTFSAGIDQPLRLTSPEATGLLVALRALAEVPGVVDPEAARSAIAKIESAAGTVAHGSATVAAEPEPAPAESQAAAGVRAAVREEKALIIEYYSASRDTLSSRVVDPIRILLVGDHSYLEAWSREAEGVRLFRFDRIVEATVLDEAAAPPAPAVQNPPDTSLFSTEPDADSPLDPTLQSATLRIAPTASWLFDYYPLRSVTEQPDGHFQAEMTYGSAEWMTRLVLGLGDVVTVLEPADLAADVRSAAVAALGAYATAG